MSNANENFECFCLMVPDAAFTKEITLEDHVRHGTGHLTRTAQNLGVAKEHLGEVAKAGGLAMRKDAAGKREAARQTAHHLNKAHEALGRAHEQQTMAVRHLNALTGSQESENQSFKKGDAATREAGQHMQMMADHLDELSAQLIEPHGESGAEASDRRDQAKYRHDKAMEHHQGALDKIDEAKGHLKAAAGDLDEDTEKLLESVPDGPVRKLFSRLFKANPHHDDRGRFAPAPSISAPVGPPPKTGQLETPTPTRPASAADLLNKGALLRELPEGSLPLRKENSPDPDFYLWCPVRDIREVFEKAADGTNKLKALLVSGWASVSDYVDAQNDIVDPEGLKKAADDWWGNIRLMHKPDAVGTARPNPNFPGADECEVEIRKHPDTGTDSLWVTCLVVADHAIKLCQAGVIKGFSIGGNCQESVSETVDVAEAA